MEWEIPTEVKVKLNKFRQSYLEYLESCYIHRERMTLEALNKYLYNRRWNFFILSTHSRHLYAYILLREKGITKETIWGSRPVGWTTITEKKIKKMTKGEVKSKYLERIE